MSRTKHWHDQLCPKIAKNTPQSTGGGSIIFPSSDGHFRTVSVQPLAGPSPARLFRPMFDLDLGPPNSRDREILEVFIRNSALLVDFPHWITGDPPCFIMGVNISLGVRRICLKIKGIPPKSNHFPKGSISKYWGIRLILGQTHKRSPSRRGRWLDHQWSNGLRSGGSTQQFHTMEPGSASFASARASPAEKHRFMHDSKVSCSFEVQNNQWKLQNWFGCGCNCRCNSAETWICLRNFTN